MKKLVTNYLKTFDGLSKEVWWLALITLINRAGTVVILFLSLYLTQKLGFTKSQVGWIMTFYGFGSVAGSWIGGKLTDKIGYYKIMLTSLSLTGVLFILLQFVTSFVGFCASMFVLLLIADTFRPAMFVALSAYSKPKNRTRSLTLIRLAINLGFSAGPVAAGIIVATYSYTGLFWMDGITCLLASFLLLKVLHPKKAKATKKQEVKNPVSVYSDKPYWVFLIAMMLFGLVFLQYFSTVPLYYKEVHYLSELEIGMLMGANGFFIFLLEMPLVKWLEESKYTKIDLMIFGGVLLAFSFLVLNFTSWIGILGIGMLLMTVGEMIAFPFSNAFATERSQKGKQGEYMAMYTVSFSVAHIVSHNLGMQLAEDIGFTKTWYIVFGIAVLSGVFMFIARRMLRKGM